VNTALRARTTTDQKITSQYHHNPATRLDETGQSSLGTAALGNAPPQNNKSKIKLFHRRKSPTVPSAVVDATRGLSSWCRAVSFTVRSIPDKGYSNLYCCCLYGRFCNGSVKGRVLTAGRRCDPWGRGAGPPQTRHSRDLCSPPTAHDSKHTLTTSSGDRQAGFGL
jgi:hypothetical protein